MSNITEKLDLSKHIKVDESELVVSLDKYMNELKNKDLDSISIIRAKEDKPSLVMLEISEYETLLKNLEEFKSITTDDNSNNTNKIQELLTRVKQLQVDVDLILDVK